MGTTPTTSTRAFNVNSIRSEFPLLQREVHGKPLVYLDSAATTPKPKAVLEAVADYDMHCTANVHRAVHELSTEATEAYEGARTAVATFINAARREELVWTRGTTEAINLFAWSWGCSNLQDGDHILLSEMEHHANIVPWQLLRERVGIEIDVAPITDEGVLTVDAVLECITDRTKLVSLAWISNVLGTINPVQEICAASYGVVAAYGH